MPDLLALVAALPRELCGVIFRHDGVADRAILAREVAGLCRARRIPIVLAGALMLPGYLRAGVHLRGGTMPYYGKLPSQRLLTASAHDLPELRRGKRARAQIVFVSPVFSTMSHPGAPSLGAFAYRRLAYFAAPASAAALGGISGASVKTLGKSCLICGAISALVVLPRTI